ncbi:MAG: L-2-hydroxyglutarate oxidase [Pseudomonadales bacterium]|nr:L-2-hydroxyglutarate oxidase [Pseudomonadales bacterium]MCP5170681.1 L-2-hydroxyglutarate oxidase [Pseudomonadales bacterium]
MYDFIVIGGGIVGVSTALQLQQRYPKKRILLLEKEAKIACHQTGHNSGVIHAGVYYAPDSLKAEFCKRGLKATIDFCRANNIDFRQPGKLLVATDELEYQRMLALKSRCEENRLMVDLLSSEELREKEPAITGVGALYIADTGIVDYRQVAVKIAEQFQAFGGELVLDSRVVNIDEQVDQVTVSTAQHEYSGKFLIACAGLAADRIARMMGVGKNFQIIPFRGEYYQLPKEKTDCVKHLIYPIPDPKMPFLGVHLTPMIGGAITVGPNALLGWKREGYGKFNVDLADSIEMLGFGGFWKVAAKNWHSGLGELKDSWWKAGYLRRVQKYCPELTVDDLLPWPAGIRAQAVLRDGSLVQDFLFESSPRSLHVCNAPSPAATSAIPIGNYICELVVSRAL